MKGSTGYIIGIILTVGIGAILQYFLCCGAGIAGETSSGTDEVISEGLPFVVANPDGGMLVNSSSNFDFPLSSYSFVTPISDELETSLSNLRDYLSSNEDVSLDITGFAYATEDNLSAFPTLGEARANAVKSAMIERGISGNQLTVRGSVFEGAWAGQDSLIRGPVSYSLMEEVARVTDPEEGSDTLVDGTQNNESRAEDFAAFVRELQEDPLVLHFETGSAYVNLTSEERQLISRLNQFIDQNSQATIIIDGHTDNSGSPEVNIRLGKERAEFLKSYLVRNGFRPDRIQTVSKGQSSPVASNDTPSGMAQNRRAVLTIQN